MRLRERINWPLGSGASSYGPSSTFTTGGEGVLRKVELLPPSGTQPERLRLEIEREGQRGSTVLALKNHNLQVEIQELLQRHIGKTIMALGDLEVSDPLIPGGPAPCHEAGLLTTTDPDTHQRRDDKLYCNLCHGVFEREELG